MSEVTLDNYVELACRTESNNFSEIKERISGIYSMRLIHACLGLNSEFGELCEDESRGASKEELGDLAWYIAIIIDNAQLNLRTLCQMEVEDDFTASRLAYHIGIINDVTKRAIYYGKSFEGFKFPESLAFIISYISENCIDSFEDCLKANIEKLKIRYPDKFDMTKAYERQIDVEQRLFNAQQIQSNPFKEGDFCIDRTTVQKPLLKVVHVNGDNVTADYVGLQRTEEKSQCVGVCVIYKDLMLVTVHN